MALIDVLRILRGAVRDALQKCQVSLPGRVTAGGYDRALRRATVQPAIRLRFLDGQVAERAPLAERPVLLPRGGGFGLWFDLEGGDPVVTLVADESTAAFYETGQTSTPVFGQLHQPSDAVVLPGAPPDTEQSPVNGPGQCVVGAADLSAAIIFSRETLESPGQQGRAEIRVSVRLDLGGQAGVGVGRLNDPVGISPALATWMGNVQTALTALAQPIAPLVGTTIGTISGASTKVFSE